MTGSQQARNCKKTSFRILVGIYCHNIPTPTPQSGYHGVTEVAKTANTPKMAEKCINCISARHTLPHTNPRGGRRHRTLYADSTPLPLPPPSLEIGWKVPDHGRQRRPKQILLELVEVEKVGFHPVSILKILSFFRENAIMDENQIGPNMNTTPVQKYVRGGPYPSGKAVPLQMGGPRFKPQWDQSTKLQEWSHGKFFVFVFVFFVFLVLCFCPLCWVSLRKQG